MTVFNNELRTKVGSSYSSSKIKLETTCTGSVPSRGWVKITKLRGSGGTVPVPSTAPVPVCKCLGYSYLL